MNAPLALYEEEARRIRNVCDRLVHQAQARSVFVVDKNGYLLASAGETDRFDTTSLASLVAGEIAATGALAELIGEKEFSTFLHEGVHENIHITVVARSLIVVVLFDRRSSLGYVRLQVKRNMEELAAIYDTMLKRSQSASHAVLMNEITDEDIDRLFSF